MPEAEHLDAVIVGGNVRALVAAYLLDRLGYKAVLIDRARVPGGVDRSFVAEDGSIFDHGLHVLDENRSQVATRLFRSVVDQQVHRVRLRRAIVMRNEIMPYAPQRGQLPESLARLLPEGELVDDLGDRAPTRAALSEIYGKPFADMIFDEVLPSYPSENRHREFGVDESKLLANIYPWFFPRAKRSGKSDDESRSFHDQLRAGIEQHVLYPREGGFGGFVDGFVKKLAGGSVELFSGAEDFSLDLEPGTHRVRSVSAGGRTFVAQHYFWAGAWGQLCGLIDLPCQNTATDRVVLGSFRLDRPAFSDFQEILVGDPQFRINRIFFPARFRESDDPLMQIEFAFPTAEDRPDSGDAWRELWLDDCRKLGILTDHRVEFFDFRSFCMHFNGYGMEGEALRDADPAQIHPDSNLRPIVPSMANLNLNGYVPRSVSYVASVLAGEDL